MQKRLYLIELFVGSHSVSRCVRKYFGRKLDVRISSVDNVPSSNPTILVDMRFRALPGFQQSRNGKQPRTGFLRNDSLNEREAKFRKKIRHRFSATPVDALVARRCLWHRDMFAAVAAN